MQAEIWIIYTYSGKFKSYQQNQKNENNNIISLYRLPWQPNYQIVQDFTKNEHIQSKISPPNKGFDCLFMYTLYN